jgi:hypothetical protein
VGSTATPGAGSYIGGLVGQQQGAITGAFATGTVTAAGSGSQYVGGLVGDLAYSPSLNTAYASGAVKVGANASYVGGLIGQAYNSAITQAYALGNVTAGAGSTDTGGLIGRLAASSRINQTYSVGAVSGAANVGGLVGYVESGSRIANSYWNVTTSGRANMCGGADAASSGCVNTAGLTTAQMTDAATYGTTYAGWNFTGVWSPPNQTGQSGQTQAYYPQLYALTPVVVATPNGATRTYGSANPIFTGAITAGGVNNYLFGPAGDTLPVANLFATSAMAGSSVGNYVITRNLFATSTLGQAYRVIVPTAATLTITPAALTLTYNANALSQTYGAVNPALASGNVVATGLVNGDTVAGVTTGAAAWTTTATATSGVGSYGVTGSGLSANSANYTITFAQGAGNATAVTINPATLLLVYGADAMSRTYGAANPAFTGKITAVGLANGDTLAGVTSGTAAWGTTATTASSVGNYAVNGSGLAGNSANYTFQFAQAAGNATALKITPAALTVTYTAKAATKVYGKVNPALTGTTAAAGLVNGDTLAGVTTGTAAWTTTAGTASAVGSYAINGKGLAGNSANYTFTFLQAAGNATAFKITPAPLTVTYTALATSSIYGGALPTLSGSVGATGLVNGDTLAGVTTGTAAWATPATSASPVGSYAITGSGLAGNSANYTFSFAQAAGNATALSITPAPLTVTYSATAASSTYGAAIPTVTGTVGSTGLVNGDTLSGITTGTAAWATTATSTSGAGNYAITGSGLAGNSGNYTFSFVQDAINATAYKINPAALTVTYTAKAATKVYGAANPTLSGTVAATGLVNGDLLTGVTTGTASWTSGVNGTTGVGSYAITGKGLVASSANYTITFGQAAGNATAFKVTARGLVLTPNALVRAVGAANPTTDTATANAATSTTGLVNGDTIASISVTSPATVASPAGTYALSGSNALFSTGSAANYAITYQTNATGLTVQ